jgi:hypothetical protein
MRRKVTKRRIKGPWEPIFLVTWWGTLWPMENLLPIFYVFSELVVEAKVLLFTRRGQILHWGSHQGEVDTVIATNNPLAWGEESSSSSTVTSPSPSSSPPRSMSSPSQFV